MLEAWPKSGLVEDCQSTCCFYFKLQVASNSRVHPLAYTDCVSKRNAHVKPTESYRSATTVGVLFQQPNPTVHSCCKEMVMPMALPALFLLYWVQCLGAVANVT